MPRIDDDEPESNSPKPASEAERCPESNNPQSSGSPSPEKKKILGHDPGRECGSDFVKIHSARYVDSEKDDSGSWEDVEKVVQGIRWLVPGWIPYGMLTGLIAEPKAGKSAFAVWALARPLLIAGSWFNGSRGLKNPRYVVYCDTERSAAVNLERAKKWGLPLNRIKTPFSDVLAPIKLENESHINRILSVVCRYKAPLVIIDSFRGAHDGDENNSRIVRPLRALGGIAEETGASIVLIHHMKKMPIDEDLTINSGRGSNAFLAAVRCQIAIDRPDPQSDWRRVQVLGENLGIAPESIGFRITETGLEFGVAPGRTKRETKQQSAEEWLRFHMEPGRWYPSKEIDRDAERFGYKGNALQRAKEALGIVQPKYVRRSKDGWECRLPGKIDC